MRTSDFAQIPNSLENRDWVDFLEWYAVQSPAPFTFDDRAPDAPTTEETNLGLIQTKLINAIADLEAECSVQATWAARSTAYKFEVCRRGLLVVAKLIRYLLSRLDSE